MKKIVACFVLVLFFTSSPCEAQAGMFPELQAPFSEMAKLTKMLAKEKDIEKQKDDVNKLKAVSEKFESALTARMAAKSNDEPATIRLNQIKKLWDEYRKTRDDVLIPARLGGDMNKIKGKRKGQRKLFQLLKTLVEN